MCGIIGYAGSKQAAPLILSVLSTLEYRGYDSAGLAVNNVDGSIRVEKCKGRLKVLKDKINNGENLHGNVGIGHTRWATHGVPSDVNAHPHLSMNRKISVVHNGIIENYIEIKELLISKGFKFISDTDTEIVTNLIEYFYDGDPLKTIQKIIKKVVGSYTLVIMFEDIPDKIYAVRKNTPLIAGLCSDGNFVASDISALLPYTHDMYLLEDEEIVELSKERINLYDIDLNPISKDVFKVAWDVQSAEKGGYEHFMLKEIMEQPRAISDTISSRINGENILFDDLDFTKKYLSSLDRIYILGCGSAYYIGVALKYAMEKFLSTPIDVDLASEFRYRTIASKRKMKNVEDSNNSSHRITRNTLVILISQSGETADTIAALRESKKYGAKTLSIVNVVGSTIARESDNVLYTHAGQEVAVATTKAFTSQLSLALLLAEYFARVLGYAEDTEFLNEIKKVPDNIKKINSKFDEIKKYAETFSKANYAFFLGRGIDYPIAMEGALKLKETAYINAEAYAAGELKHGPISLISEGTLVVAVVTQKELYEKMFSNIREVKSRGAKVLMITNDGNTCAEEVGDFVYYIPETHPVLTPLLSVVPLQQFGYYSAVLRNCNVDKPKNLAKSVVVE